jgi:hypothetical protein
MTECKIIYETSFVFPVRKGGNSMRLLASHHGCDRSRAAALEVMPGCEQIEMPLCISSAVAHLLFFPGDITQLPEELVI